MEYVFLGFDGVLNASTKDSTPIVIGDKLHPVIESNKIKLLNKLTTINDEPIFLIICSIWREKLDQILISDWLACNGLSPRFLLSYALSPVIENRADAIMRFLNDLDDRSSYVIIDSNSDYYQEYEVLQKRLVSINRALGLMDDDVTKAIEILQTKE